MRGNAWGPANDQSYQQQHQIKYLIIKKNTKLKQSEFMLSYHIHRAYQQASINWPVVGY